MPISSGANGWPIRHFKKAPAPEPKLKKFVNVMPRDTYYPTPVKPPRPPSPAPNPGFYYTPTTDRRIRPSPSPSLTPEPRRKPRPSPPPSPEPRRKQSSPPPGDGCCGAGGACAPGCCTRMCSNSVCCWSDDAYRRFSQRGRPAWWSRDGGKGRGCCGNRCCRMILACLLALLLLLLLIAAILALVFGIPAFNRRSTVTIINGVNVYRTVLGMYQNCTDPNTVTPADSLLPLCNATTTVLVTTPVGFTPPFTDPPSSGQSRSFPIFYLCMPLFTTMLSVLIRSET